MVRKIKTVSLFSGAGIGELLLPHDIIDIVVANEILELRAKCYKSFYKNTKIIIDDITNDSTKNNIIKIANERNAKLLIATPPCQGLSTLGKNKVQKQYLQDTRNYLIFHTFDIIDKCNFDYVLIENVPKFLQMYFPDNGEYKLLEDIISERYESKYIIESRILNAMNYGVSQSRPRAIIKMYKKGLNWNWPKEEDPITLEDSIGHLPSLEPGESSDIKWHFAKKHNDRIVDAIRHTATGSSAIANPVYYPKKKDGSRIRGFHNTYKRMVWDKPCPARTTYSGSLSSHNNIHPGRKYKKNNEILYSDPRVLTLLETFIVSSIPEDIDFPDWASDTFIRTVIGEAIPPKLMLEILKPLFKK